MKTVPPLQKSLRTDTGMPEISSFLFVPAILQSSFHVKVKLDHIETEIEVKSQK